LILSALFLKKRLKLFIIFLSIALYIFTIEPTKDAFLIPLEDAYKVPSKLEIKTCDAYIVLGGGVLDNAPGIDGKGILTGDALYRVIGAYQLYLINQKPIILSGGKVFERKVESEVAKKQLLSFGVKENHIITESMSKDTFENAKYVKEICDKNKINRILLITSAFHMKRSQILFSKYFKEIIPYPTGYKTARIKYDLFSFLPDASNMACITFALKEYMGILFYKIMP
jgi:uncharacterized SAM-binding protein YcdF (DUF218 family)